MVDCMSVSHYHGEKVTGWYVALLNQGRNEESGGRYHQGFRHEAAIILSSTPPEVTAVLQCKVISRYEQQQKKCFIVSAF